MSDLQIHVGDTAEEFAGRFSDAWRRAERGEPVNERHLSFDSFETLVAAGLVDREEGGAGLTAPYDAISTRIALQRFPWRASEPV